MQDSPVIQHWRNYVPTPGDPPSRAEVIEELQRMAELVSEANGLMKLAGTRPRVQTTEAFFVSKE